FFSFSIVDFCSYFLFFFFQAEDGIRDRNVTGVQTCALPISDFWHLAHLTGSIIASLHNFVKNLLKSADPTRTLRSENFLTYGISLQNLQSINFPRAFSAQSLHHSAVRLSPVYELFHLQTVTDNY